MKPCACIILGSASAYASERLYSGDRAMHENRQYTSHASRRSDVFRVCVLDIYWYAYLCIYVPHVLGAIVDLAQWHVNRDRLFYVIVSVLTVLILITHQTAWCLVFYVSQMQTYHQRHATIPLRYGTAESYVLPACRSFPGTHHQSHTQNASR